MSLSICFFLCNQWSLWTGVEDCQRKKAMALPNECFLLHLNVQEQSSRAGAEPLSEPHL